MPSSWRSCNERAEQYQLFHQHHVSQAPASDAQVAVSQDIPYIEENADKYEPTTTADNGLKAMPQVVVVTDSTAQTTCNTGGRSVTAEISAPTTILSASSLGDVSPCQMAQVVQPQSPCVAIKRRNIFSCCSRKRRQQRRHVSASMAASGTGCCSAHPMLSTKSCCNKKVNIFS